MGALFRIKVCGVMNPPDAQDVARAGADAIGLNFYSSSPRGIDVPQAQQIIAAVPNTVCRVGVFVNAPVAEINATAQELSLDFVQLHGDEPVEVIPQITSAAVIKAIRCGVNCWQEVEQVVACQPAGILLDAFVAGQFGGTGKRPDWQMAARIREQFNVPLVLAGGLHEENVAAAIRCVRPHGVDVASGVESAPGQKSRARVERFVQQARHAFAAAHGE